MLRIVVDVGAALCAFAMVLRLRRFLTPTALRFGVLMSALACAGGASVALTRLDVAGYRPDIGTAAIVFAFTAVSRGRWERFVAPEHLRDARAGVNDLHGRYVGAVVLAVLLGLALDWAVAS